tara:strand:- start:2162 stop:2410 length:249 start_codon:yes stop_codon:yes gene_type:complete
MNSFAESDEVRETLHRYYYSLTKEQRLNGSILIRQDDFDLLKDCYFTTKRDDPLLVYRFHGLSLVVIDNPTYRFEYIDAVLD